IFGNEYVPAIPALNVLMASLVLIFLYFPVGAILNACDKQTRNTAHLGIVAVSNIILNLILIPLMGFVGAAWASLLSYVLLFILGIVVVEKIISYGKKTLFVSLVKILIGCAVMTLAILGVKEYLHFLFVIPLGIAIYFSILFFLKEFTLNDLTQLKKMIKKEEI
ncbi:MAG: polysaccharide biosynthesis C-terminal domain-containing protein, partial [Patescibacteria group bacterium]